MELFLHIWQTLLLVSLLILAVWLMDKLRRMRTGYRWRKALWAVLAVCLLLPFPMRIPTALEVVLPAPERAVIKEQAAENKAADGTQKPSAALAAAAAETKDASAEAKDASAEAKDAAAEGKSAAAGVNHAADGIAAGDFPYENDRDGGFSAPYPGQSAAEAVRTGALPVFFGIWGAGALILLALRLCQYRKMRKKYMAEAVICENQEELSLMERLCREQKVQKKIVLCYHKSFLTPMLFGYIRPVILLPFLPYKEEELEAVLRHEITHYRSKDLWYKLLLVIVCDVYWFWPLLRLMKAMAFGDVECVCDQKATRGMSLEEKGIYGGIILKTMAGRSSRRLALTTQFGGNKRMAKRRMENIFQKQKRGLGTAILCALLLVLVTGTACVSVKIEEEEAVLQTAQETEGGETETGQAAEDEPETADAASAEGQEGKVLLVQANLLAGADQEALWEKLSESSPGVAFEAAEYNLDGEQRLMETDQFLEQGTFMSYTWSSKITALGQEGKLADLSAALEKRGWTQYISEADRELLMDEDGSIYGIPYSRYALGLMCNKKLFEQAGLVDENGAVLTPKTWEELAQSAALIKEKTGQAGLCLLAKDNAAAWHFTNIAWNFGVEEFCTLNADGTYTARLDDPAAIAAMEFVKDLKWKYDVLTAEPENEDYNTGYAHLAQGTAAMYIAGNDSAAMLAGGNFEPDDLVLAAVPAGPQGDQHSLSGCGAIVISANADEEEIEAALELIELLQKGPELNEEKKTQIAQRVADEAAQNIPTIPQFPVWNNEEVQRYEENVLEEQGNVGISATKEFFDAVKTPGNLKEEGDWTSDLYGEILSVMHQVLNDPDADVEALMKAANENYQKLIDAGIE